MGDPLFKFYQRGVGWSASKTWESTHCSLLSKVVQIQLASRKKYKSISCLHLSSLLKLCAVCVCGHSAIRVILCRSYVIQCHFKFIKSTQNIINKIDITTASSLYLSHRHFVLCHTVVINDLVNNYCNDNDLY